MTNVLQSATVKDLARELIQNYSADAPFHVEIQHREDLRVTEFTLEKDMSGACFLSIRVEDQKGA